MRDIIPIHYKGREQAYIKHTLLRKYLEKLFMIIGQHEKCICYVDCFAGPWQEGSNDLDDTSIAISLEIIKKYQIRLSELGKDVAFRALFIEKNRDAFQKLEKFLKSEKWDSLDITPLNGSFYELRNKICDWCGSYDFTFFFIDPTGWKRIIEPDTLKPLLSRKKTEFLINFMFDFIRRAQPQEEFAEDMNNIFGEVQDVSNLKINEREKYFIKRYAERLKQFHYHAT